jgi:hypothetical protein
MQRDTSSRSALARGAADARSEADRLLAEAKRALILEGTSDVLYNVATDAIDAWRRAEDRATLAQQLADQEAGGYNVWDGAA